MPGFTNPRIEEFFDKVMQRSYEMLQFQKWCEKFVAKWNTLPMAAQITVEECLDNKFIELIYKSQNVPSAGVAPVSFNSPEEAADLVMNYTLSCS